MILIAAFAALWLPAIPMIESRLEQVGPVPVNGKPTRSENQSRAVVLVHGFIFHLREAGVAKASFRPWQVPGSVLVKTLEKEADVFSFAYGQNASLEDIVKQGGLREAIAHLKKLGYSEVVLIGHSAGGLVARQFVEDNPDSSVRKVIQVCAPNGGTPTAKTKVHASQQLFVDSLTEESRKKCLEERKHLKIPEKVEFVCVLGCIEGSNTDGVVPCVCQWTPDLWKQGIPVLPLAVSHHQSTRTDTSAAALAKLVREKQQRWKDDQVEVFSKRLFKK